ncbi:MAG: toll/interleukin-1 receptor domain-containing protein [Gammaproteobacteria bacterium]
MESETSHTAIHQPSRCLIRLLDRSRRIDYLWAFIIGFWPIVLAALIGAHHSIDGYRGYLDTVNWWSLSFLFPAVLLAFRWVMNKIVPVGSARLPDNPPPIINILKDMPAKAWAYDRLRGRILAKKNVRITLILAVIVHILDLWPVVAPYLTGIPSNAKDWTAMFLLQGQVGKAANLVLLFFAYSVQFCVAFIGILTIVMMLRHNVFFVRNIYQRRNSGKSADRFQFRIDVDDVDRCFGFRIANEAFNTQVKALMIAGSAMFLSRYVHAGQDGSSIIDLFGWPPELPGFSFPMAGQWLMALFWLFALFIVAIPAFVKLLPCLPGSGGHLSHLSVADYLHEFFSDESWPKDRRGKDESVASVAAKFARNSFWPTGDNRASVLFLFSYWIFFVILLPPLEFDLVTLILTFTVYGIAAYFARSATFSILKWVLRYVDEMLVLEKDEIPEEPLQSDKKCDINVFISYRRSDTAPYARSLFEHLIGQFPKEKIFIDIDSIEPGEKFGHSIEKALAGVDAVIVLIGKEWAAAVNENNQPRIHDPKDMVRFEISTALKLGKRLFPVLVGGARMPSENELPEPLKELAQFNAIELSDHRWTYDLGLLLKALKSTA